ncbi:Serine/threonine-protein kinase PknB [Gemmata sp. SH-PL17]|uniref:WD40 repeat domain-containing serine/threonine protein kinase n=1 Tax=Gemmata sp. SH-PL17 TaxID=1630693 RepID=UPI00078D2FA1|nr:serine/threonine-protein kinase [Gemmata sp. SH-PL17]AMV30317.1 Serine/threonine-protein kinase PknB [Gemmata sp. SH-PL17]
MSPENQISTDTPNELTIGHTADVPMADGATSGAESLLNHLKQASKFVPRPAPGAPQIPDYEILEELGHGGMGIVFKARHLPLNRVVALKMVLTSDQLSPSEIARFRGEAEAVAAIKHTNVVRVYELSPFESERPYFTMEFVENGSLAKFLKEHKRLDPYQAAELIARVADGLQAAHDADVVHRDIKPANILLSAEPKSNGSSPTSRFPFLPQVSDFGLAKRLATDVTRTQGPAGTPAYMAPEQAGGKAKFVGPAADVYALGVVLYECLTEKPPFDDQNQWVTVQQVLDATPVSPRVAVPSLPRDLELICLKCLEKEPHHRYPSAAALADDLRRFLAGLPVSVRPIGPVTRVLRWARRRPTAAALVALCAGLLFAVPPLAVWEQGRLDQRGADAAAAQEAARLAKLAEDREKEAHAATAKSVVAALKLADAQELFAIQNKLRTRAADRPLSWTLANHADLSKAVKLVTNDSAAVTDLRSAAAVALLNADLQELSPVVKGFSASAAATDPKTGMVAIGQYLIWASLPVRVHLIEPSTGTITRELTFTAGLVRDPAANIKRAPDYVSSLVFSSDGKRLYVGTRSSQVIRFDLDKPGKEPAKVWKASITALEQIALSPDGKTLYGLCRPEKAVHAWSTDTGKLLGKLEPAGEAPITSFAVLANGEVLTCDAAQIRRWGPNRRMTQAVTNPGAWRLAVTSTNCLLVGDRRNLDTYDRQALTPLERFETPELRRGIHEDYVRTIVEHPSGAYIATSSGDSDRTVRVWELASGKLVGTVSVTGTGPIALAWSGDGKTLFATAYDQLARWSFRAPDAQQFACVDGSTIAAAAFGSSDRIAALTDQIGVNREFLMGPVGTTKNSTQISDRGGNGRAGVAAAPDGKLAVTPAVPGLIGWSSGTPIPSPAFTTKITWCPRFDPSGNTLWALVDATELMAFDPATKAVRATWSNAASTVASGVASLDALAVGRAVVAVGSRNGSVYWLKPETCELVTSFPNFGDPVQSVAITPDESLIVAGTQNGKLRVIRTADQKEQAAATAHTGGTTAISVSRDGLLLATGGRDRVVRLWKRDGDRFEPLFAVSDLSGPVRELQFHSADNRLLVLVAQEHAVRVWDVDALKAQLGQFQLAW